MKKKYLLFFSIVFLAGFLRFHNLGQNPPSLTWDEASWGYNAYSLGIDGKDEFGRFLPLDYLESFGDFKPPIYAYLDVLPVKIFGLNEFAVRFPSAFLGTLTVLITYFLTKRIFSDSKLKFKISFFATLILAISPWHINLSRAAFEANVATFFLVAGIWLFLGGVQEKRWYLPLAVISFVLSMYTFNTARVVAPFLVLLLTLGFRRQLLERKKQVLISILLGVVIFTPLSRFMLTPQAKLRFAEVNIFSDISIIERTNQQIKNDNNAWWSKILHNRRFTYGVEYVRHYLDNFSPGFLFIKGDGNPKFSTQDTGQLYLWDLPFLIAGILFLFRRREGNWWIIPLWLIIGIIPAATARETPHALRIEATLPTFQILVAYGLTHFLQKISNVKMYFLVFLFLLFNFLYYYHGYYTHYPREFSGEWQYGYKESIAYTQSAGKDYKQIVATTDLGRPYIYYLFYTKTDPRHFRKTVKVRREALGFVNVEGFDKYIFTRNFTPYHKFNEKTLYINSPKKVHPKASILRQFRLLNGETILTAYVL